MAEWEPTKNRRDPVEVLLASDEGRVPELVPIRHGRMMQSRPSRFIAEAPR